METLIYGIAGIIILLGTAFLFTYYDSLDSKEYHGTRKFRRTVWRVNRRPECREGLAPGTRGRMTGFPLMKKQTKYHLGIFTFLLLRNAKRNKKGATQFDL
jgi:hypothetical protein